ncbi:2TM domain-containing protein [Ignavibacteria bacterium CHB1]|jgi:hypothetical protein|nr:MAG: hypothetical protein UZ04_CHB001000715 [Chlorobi bacterium OLB4]MBV6398998.1 hypothetical protein [Ignavibacteria bacterium]MBW7856687.1 2TM domain-containing protein [Ignavibacteria bacterium]MDL1887942.1 2TM domain-containing protein [Ignavibacteria bacterium CHB1]OQY77169.1 MAG: hypothetical protein B6D43_07535 [Ignavibacteriales bacterium UTCHB1]
MEEKNISSEDALLWRKAKARAGFKRHLYTYLVINAFLWLFWLITNFNSIGSNGIPWPAFVTLGWGIGLAFNFFGAYMYNFDNLTEREFKKLKEKQ